MKFLNILILAYFIYQATAQDDSGTDIRLGGSSILWSYQMGGAGVSSPLIYNVTKDGVEISLPLVIVGSNDRFVYALHASNGSLVWKRDVGSRIQIAPIPVHLKKSAKVDTPLDFILVSGERGVVLAMDPVDGEIIWTQHLKRPISKPSLSDRFAYIGSAARVVVIRLDDGKQVSNVTFDGEDIQAIIVAPLQPEENTTDPDLHATPVFRRLFVTSARGHLFSVQVQETRRNAREFEVLWEHDSGGDLDHQSAPTWIPGRVFLGGFSKRLDALDDVTGEVLWTFQAKDVVAQAAVSHDGSLVIAGSSDQYLYGLSIDTGDLVWSTKVGHSVQSMPSIGNDGSIIVTGTAPAKLKKLQSATKLPRVMALDSRGEVRWTVSVDGMVFSSSARSRDCSVYFTDTSWLVYRVGECIDEPRDEL